MEMRRSKNRRMQLRRISELKGGQEPKNADLLRARLTGSYCPSPTFSSTCFCTSCASCSICVLPSSTCSSICVLPSSTCSSTCFCTSSSTPPHAAAPNVATNAAKKKRVNLLLTLLLLPLLRVSYGASPVSGGQASNTSLSSGSNKRTEYTVCQGKHLTTNFVAYEGVANRPLGSE